MTTLQKDIITKLLLGYNIAGNAKYGYRLRDLQQVPVRTFSAATFYRLKPILRKYKGCFVVNKSKVRQLHGNTFAKRTYKHGPKDPGQPAAQSQAKRTRRRPAPAIPEGLATLPFAEFAPPVPPAPKVRTCSVCGCTENDACYIQGRGTCWWVGPEVCSHCHHWPGQGKRYSVLINETRSI